MPQELEIGINIKDLRKKSGLNKRQFAEELGVFSPDYLGKMERGDVKEPKYSFLLAIGEFCGVSINYILTGIELPEMQNISMQTQSAKQALQHLNKCARSIKRLDAEAYPALQALEREVALHEDPEIRKHIDYFEPSHLAGI